ncbi:hypothetical protein BC833DRAFT_353621 [Globomyces pollinis-pini]|nr:hypothetical protein BC833DRAFT_353621 [Globomyces pollinis-pini]
MFILLLLGFVRAQSGVSDSIPATNNQSVPITENLNNTIVSLFPATCSPPIDSITLIHSHEALTAFASLSCSSHFPASLSLSGNINSTTAFQNITSIAGSLRIIGTSLPNLIGFSSLTTIGSHLVIQDNRLLVATYGFSSLTSIQGSLYLLYNLKLESLTGFGNLISIGQSNATTGLFISGNKLLNSISGFKSIRSIGPQLLLNDLPALNTLKGLPPTNSQLTNVTVTFMSSLRSLSPLSTFQSHPNGTSITISNNKYLPSLAGLDNLKQISSFTLTNNPSLTDISTLKTSTFNLPIQIQNNNRLCDVIGLDKINGAVVNNQCTFYPDDTLFSGTIHLYSYLYWSLVIGYFIHF